MDDCLQEAVIDCSEEYVVTRHVSVAIDKGRKADPITEEVIVDAAVTPMSGKDMRRLGSGQVVDGSILVISIQELFTSKSSTCRIADIIHHNGAKFQIDKVLDWSHIAGFYECIGLRMDR